MTLVATIRSLWASAISTGFMLIAAFDLCLMITPAWMTTDADAPTVKSTISREC